MPSVQSEEQQSNYDNDQTSNSTSTLLEFDPDNSQTSPSISPNLSQANSPMSPSPFQISPSMSPNFPCQISPSMSPNPTVSSGSALSPSSSFIDEFFSADEPIEQIEEEMENEHSIANSKSNSPFSNIEDVIMECENFTPLNRQLSNSSNIMESEDPAHQNEKEVLAYSLYSLHVWRLRLLCHLDHNLLCKYYLEYSSTSTRQIQPPFN